MHAFCSTHSGYGLRALRKEEDVILNLLCRQYSRNCFYGADAPYKEISLGCAQCGARLKAPLLYTAVAGHAYEIVKP